MARTIWISLLNTYPKQFFVLRRYQCLRQKLKLKAILDLGQMPSRYLAGVGARARYVLQHLTFWVRGTPNRTPRHQSHYQLPLCTIPYISMSNERRLCTWCVRLPATQVNLPALPPKTGSRDTNRPVNSSKQSNSESSDGT